MKGDLVDKTKDGPLPKQPPKDKQATIERKPETPPFIRGTIDPSIKK